MVDRFSGTPVAFIYVADRERALEFYQQKLGLKLRSADTFGDFIELEGALVRVTVMPGHQPHAHPVLGWNVADMGVAVDALSSRGVEFLTYEGMGQDERGVWTSRDGRTKVVFFADPEGNVLSLSQT